MNDKLTLVLVCAVLLALAFGQEMLLGSLLIVVAVAVGLTRKGELR